MADLVVIVPSRGRPDAIEDLLAAFAETCTADTELAIAIDADDPQRAAYLKLADRLYSVSEQASGTMVSALNQAAEYATTDQFVTPGPFAIGFMGDDHRPRTVGWDAAYLEALHDLGTGIVYGNDLLQGPNLPTQCAMTADIIRAVGHMAPPALRHMYCDNYWRDLGQQAGCLRYLPDVVVEHMHPFAGKAEWTEGHKRVNDRAVYDHDAHAYAAYVRDRLAADVAAVRGLR